VRRQLSVCSNASDVINSYNKTMTHYSLTEPEVGCVLSGSSDQMIEVGCCCIVNVYSAYGKFKMLVELVLRGTGDDDDFGVKFLKIFNKRGKGFVFSDREVSL